MTRPSVTAEEVTRWAETISGIARTSIAFSENPYDRERVEELLEVAADMLASLSGEPPVEVMSHLTGLVGSGVPGYVTPKVGVGAFVGNDEGKLLLIKRTDTHRWFFPTGWCDVGYSASEVVKKEVREECGLDVEPVSLVTVVDGMRAGSPIPHYNIVFLCKLLGGELRPHPLECEDIGWFGADELPEPMVGKGHWAALAFAALRGEVTAAKFDPPRDPIWRVAPGESLD